jgi:SAM-dependent methyltransferase
VADVLATTLAAPIVAGSNRKGEVDGACWRFVLPRLRLGRTLCLGLPSPAALAGLARASDEVVVVAHDGPAERPVNVRLLAGVFDGRLPLAQGAADLVYAARLPAPGLAAELRRVLAPDGVIYLEPRGAAFGRVAVELQEAFGAALPLSLAPPAGEPRVVAPATDPRALAEARGRSTPRGRGLPAIGRRIRTSSRRIVGRSAPRQAFLFAPDADAPVAPPRYLREAAATGGLDLSEYRWAFAAPGDYASQKVLFFLFAPPGAPDLVVKLTREERWNARLENEWRALRLLAASHADLLFPRPAFFAAEAGLALLGEQLVQGVPLPPLLETRAGLAAARAAVEELVRLAAATHRDAAAADVAGALEGVLAGVTELYPLERRELEFLRERIAVLADGGRFPVVVQHGDPGPWNLVLVPGGRPALLDWEAAELTGMPLWDVLYLLRSCAFARAGRLRRRDPVRPFAGAFLRPTPLAELLVEATERVCAETGLAERLVEPLFYTCWMHRALKEAARLPPGEGARGRYFRLLRFCIEHRDAPGLRRLFTLGGRSP